MLVVILLLLQILPDYAWDMRKSSIFSPNLQSKQQITPTDSGYHAPIATNTISTIQKVLTSSVFALSIFNFPLASFGEETAAPVAQVPLYTKRTSDVQPYNDINRGFKLLRPFGFNEFDGNGGGYAIKFASLFDVDENVVIGSSAASADKTSIKDYGSLQSIGEKLAKKRGGQIVSSRARETDGVLFYEFQFENPVDANLPRPKNSRPEKVVELYELCVYRGKLWSVQATSNDKLFPSHENYLRVALASFFPRL